VFQINSHISKYLPVYIASSAILAYFFPFFFSNFYDSTSILLGFVLFLTGLSMELSELKVIKDSTKELLVGLVLKWTLTVFISIGLAKLFFSTSPDLQAGLILTGSVPSGTAATMYTFLAGGSTSLIVAMGIIDVFISPVLTPLIMQFSTEHTVVVSFLELAKKIFFIVILPIIIGISIRQLQKEYITRIKPYTKFASSFTIVFIVVSVVSGVSTQISMEFSLFFVLLIVVFLQVWVPMIGGYKISLLLGLPREKAIAILFQVGLCNSALAAILA
jgi:bile acid:Na+ symporter, BASS family